MALKSKLLAGAAVLMLAAPGAAFAKSGDEARIKALEAQVADLKAAVEALRAAQAAPAPVPVATQQDVAALRTEVQDLKVSTDKSVAALKADAPTATVTIANAKPVIASSDGRFTAAFHGVMQLDTAKYFQDDHLPTAVTVRDLNGGANFRRARLGVDGKAFGVFDYNILLDVGGSGAEDAGRIQDLWIQYSGLKPWRFRIGAFAPSTGLEDSASTNSSLFAERPAVSDLTRGLAGGDTRIGVAAIGNGERWFFSGAYTGALVSSLNSGAAAFNAPTFDEQQGVDLRVAAVPFQGKDWMTHVGATASVIAQPADLGPAAAVRYAVQLRERPELRVDGTRLIDTGAIDTKGLVAYGLELAVQKSSLLVQGEYFDINLERRNPAAGASDPSFSGWYVEGGWLLTGERRRRNIATAAFDGPTVAKPFDLKKGTWGAWELTARYSTLDLNYAERSATVADRVRGGEQDVWALGVNWFPNSAMAFMLDYYQISVDRLNTAGAQIGQDVQALNLRSQFAF